MQTIVIVLSILSLSKLHFVMELEFYENIGSELYDQCHVVLTEYIGLKIMRKRQDVKRGVDT